MRPKLLQEFAVFSYFFQTGFPCTGVEEEEIHILSHTHTYINLYTSRRSIHNILYPTSAGENTKFYIWYYICICWAGDKSVNITTQFTSSLNILLHYVLLTPL